MSAVARSHAVCFVERLERPSSIQVYRPCARHKEAISAALASPTTGAGSCSGSTLQCLQTVRKFAINPGSHAFGPTRQRTLRKSMIQHRQIHGVMAKSRDSVIRMPGKKRSTWLRNTMFWRDFWPWYRSCDIELYRNSHIPLPSHGVDHECQEASEGLWCTSGDSSASGLDALVP